jgi:protein Mpv17
MAKLLAFYEHMLKTSPFTTEVIQTGVIAALGDVSCQLLIDKKALKDYDFSRTVKMAFMGSFYVAPLLHVWYRKGVPYCVDKILPRVFGAGINKHLERPFKRGFAGMFFDQAFFSFGINAGFLFTVMFYETRDFDKSMKFLKSTFWDAQIANWKIWPAASLINFSIVPMRFRVLFANFMGYIWNVVLSWISHNRQAHEPDHQAVPEKGTK